MYKRQVVHWVSGRTTTISNTGGSLIFNKVFGTAEIDSSSGSAKAGSKGTAQSDRTTVATVTLTVSMNGKSVTSGNTIIEQAANSYSDSWEVWTVDVSADPVRIGARGGTSLLSGTAERKGIREWNSGSK